MTFRIYHTPPEGFVSKMDAAACYIQAADQCLLLRLSSEKEEAGKWGIPGGKFEPGETPHQAVLREVFEETGITLNTVDFVTTLYVQKPSVSFTFYLFRTQLSSRPAVRLSQEHDDYTWTSDPIKLPLLDGAPEILKYFT